MTDIALGPGAWAFISLYLLSLILVGWLGRRARRENSLDDFYLAGRGFGFVILLMTLFATQYSGNTFYGFTGKTYRIGYAWIMSLHFMTAIVIFYLIFAPRLRQIAHSHRFVTPPEYVQYRFGSTALTLLAALVMIAASANFVLAQLMAMGRAMQGLAPAHPEAAYQAGVIILALIMVVYGTLGGMRAIAWTDAIQGAIMLIGLSVIVVLVIRQYGPLGAATQTLLNAADPGLAAKALPPGLPRQVEWLSYVALVGIGASLYPQAIQRIYAARSPRVLRRSLAVMALLPLPTQLMAITVGVIAIVHLPGMEGASTDQVLSRVMHDIQQGSMLGHALVVLLIAAILAAMMSTADSALLAISSMLTRDVYQGLIARDAGQAELTSLGKLASWALIAILIGLALLLEDRASLVQLLDRKFDLLAQLAPAFMLGVHWRGLRTGPVLAGLVTGLVTALALAFGGFEFVRDGKVAGMLHPGVIGLALNLGIAAGGSALLSRRRTPPRSL